MKAKTVKKMLISTIMVICMIIASANTTRVFASTEGNTDEPIIKVAGITDIFNAGNSFINTGEKEASSYSSKVGFDVTDPQSFAEQFIDIGQILIAVGVVVLVAVFAVMGIRWITATPDKKAKLQQQLIGLVVAAVVIFGAIGIWGLVRNIMNSAQSAIGNTGTSSGPTQETRNYWNNVRNDINNSGGQNRTLDDATKSLK